MGKIIKKGFVRAVSPVQTVGSNGTRKQSFELFVPGYKDPLSDKPARDEEWKVDLYNARIDAAQLSAKDVNRKAEVVLYLSSKKVLVNGGVEQFIINATLGDIRFF